ncbi:hypothetical protein HYU93_00820 [Candidatus Daviesbacteria bacterium]|nr:hypothetical protein [Candidatus Daviesbacteria bacterium]
MKTLVTILIIASFLQTTILPIDLVLLILICRAYIKSEKENLYLAFVFGLFVSYLGLSNLGLQSLIYLGIVLATQMLSKLQFAGNPLLVMPIALVFLFLNQLINSYINHNTLEFYTVLLAALISLPALYLVRLWEERFIVQRSIKLKF